MYDAGYHLSRCILFPSRYTPVFVHLYLLSTAFTDETIASTRLNQWLSQSFDTLIEARFSWGQFPLWTCHLDVGVTLLEIAIFGNIYLINVIWIDIIRVSYWCYLSSERITRWYSDPRSSQLWPPPSLLEKYRSPRNATFVAGHV